MPFQREQHRFALPHALQRDTQAGEQRCIRLGQCTACESGHLPALERAAGDIACRSGVAHTCQRAGRRHAACPPGLDRLCVGPERRLLQRQHPAGQPWGTGRAGRCGRRAGGRVPVLCFQTRRQQLAAQQVERHRIEYEMMSAQQQQSLIARMQQHRPPQRPLAGVQRGEQGLRGSIQRRSERPGCAGRRRQVAPHGRAFEPDRWRRRGRQARAPAVKHHAQGLVTRLQGVQGALQAGTVDVPAHTQRQGHVEVPPVLTMHLHETAMHRQQRQGLPHFGPGPCVLGLLRTVACLNARQQVGKQRRGKEFGRGETVDALAAQLSDHLNGLDRVATAGKEMAVHLRRRATQHRLPGLAQAFAGPVACAAVRASARAVARVVGSAGRAGLLIDHFFSHFAGSHLAGSHRGGRTRRFGRA